MCQLNESTSAKNDCNSTIAPNIYWHELFTLYSTTELCHWTNRKGETMKCVFYYLYNIFLEKILHPQDTEKLIINKCYTEIAQLKNQSIILLD